ncbi:hypothetical protein Tco_1580250 [Tanacetum coccineum]
MLDLNITRDPHMIKNNIKALLSGLCFRESRMLVQFWSPVTIQKRCSLTTLDQPFGLGAVDKGLYMYRLESEQRMFAIEEEHKEELGLPGRVYCQKFPEWSFGIHTLPVRQYVHNLAACYDIHVHEILRALKEENPRSSNIFEDHSVYTQVRDERRQNELDEIQIKPSISAAAEGTRQSVVPCFDINPGTTRRNRKRSVMTYSMSTKLTGLSS